MHFILEQWKLVLTSMGTTQSICSRDYTKILPYLIRHWFSEICWPRFFCSFKWLPYTL